MDRVSRHGLLLYQHIPLQVLEAGIHPYVPPDGTCVKSDSMYRVSVPTPLKLPAILLIRTPFWPPRIEQGSCTISVVNLSIEVVFEGRAGSTVYYLFVNKRIEIDCLAREKVQKEEIE